MKTKRKGKYVPPWKYGETLISHEQVLTKLLYSYDSLKKVLEIFPILKKGAYYLRTNTDNQHIFRINSFMFESMNITTIAGSEQPYKSGNMMVPYLDKPYSVNYNEWLSQFKIEPVDKKDLILYVGWPCLGKEFEKALKKALK